MTEQELERLLYGPRQAFVDLTADERRELREYILAEIRMANEEARRANEERERLLDEARRRLRRLEGGKP